MVLLEQVAVVVAAAGQVVLPVAVLNPLMAEQVERMVVAAEHLTAVMAEQGAAVPYVLFGPEPQEHSHQQTPATYECAGSYCYCCLG
jgi:hypothetical protein